MGNKHCHNHDDFCEDDYIDSYSDPCGDPDPCSERWARDKSRDRRAKRQGAMIALIIAGVVAVAAVAFFLFAYGIVVFDDGKPVIVAEDHKGPSTTDKVIINADKIIIDKNKHHDKKHD